MPTQAGIASAFTPFSIPEGTSFVDQQVATFNDPSNSHLNSDFTAVVDWGDGTSLAPDTTTGTITPASQGSSGNFTVLGTHTYADEGSFTVSVTITETANSATATPSGVLVALEADTLSATFTPSSGPQLATFTSTNTANTASDFIALIDWGDQTSSTGTVVGSSGSFAVTGTHTYNDEGTFPVTVTIADDAPGTATASASGVMTIPEGDTISATSAPADAVPEASAFTSTVATFGSSNSGNRASDFTAVIDWGDGTTTADTSSGTITGSSGSYTVTGTHTYADEGSFSVTVTINDDAPGTALTSASGIITASENDTLSASVIQFSSTEAVAFTTPVATFTTTNTANVSGDFAAIINWGDGNSATPGTIKGSSGSFTICGSHTYADEGPYKVSVTITDDAPGTAITSACGTITASENDTLASTFTSAATITEGSIVSGQRESFISSYTGNPATDFMAVIDWGDGTSIAPDTTTGTISGSSGQFTVSGHHKYTDEGSFSITVTVSDDSAGTASTTAGGVITVLDTDSLSANITSFSATEGTSLTAQVATFTTTNLGNTASDFAAVIDWGDHTTGTGSVTGAIGNFTVTGTHLYAEDGNPTVKVTIFDDAPGTAAASVSTIDTVAEAGFSARALAIAATEGKAFTGVVATFSDPGTHDPATSFVASIRWGDLGSTLGTVSGANGNYTVTGTHTYADEEPVTMSVLVTELGTALGSTSASRVVQIDEADILSATAVPVSATQSVTFTGKVATFTDTYTANQATDFLATIKWGDNTTSAGTVTGANGHFTVTGSHSYANSGSFTMSVKISEDGGGSAMATTMEAINAAPAPVLVGQAKETFFWHSSDGQALINSFNGGSSSTALSAWLASTFPNLYGVNAGTHNLTGETNAQIAALNQQLFNSSPPVNVQILDTALSVYASTQGLGGSAGLAYGFMVTPAGLGAAYYNVGSNGSAFGVANNTRTSVLVLLKAVNAKAVNGVTYNGNTSLQSQAYQVLNGILEAGDVD